MGLLNTKCWCSFKPECCGFYQWRQFTLQTFSHVVWHKEEWEWRKHPFIQGGQIKMRHEYQDQGRSQKTHTIEWNKRGKTAACIWKIPAISWSDWTYNIIVVPSRVKSPLTLCHVAWIQGYTERRHTDVRRPNTVKPHRRESVCTFLSHLHTSHDLTHTFLACGQDIKPHSVISQTHAVLTFKLPTTRLVPSPILVLLSSNLLLSLLSEVLCSSAFRITLSFSCSPSGLNSLTDSHALRWALTPKAHIRTFSESLLDFFVPAFCDKFREHYF